MAVIKWYLNLWKLYPAAAAAFTFLLAFDAFALGAIVHLVIA